MIGRWLARFVKLTARVIGLIVLALVVAIATTLVFVFATPEFTVTPAQIRWLTDRFMPSSVELEFRDLDVRFVRPPESWFAKHLVVRADDLCVRYEIDAVRSCFDRVEIGATGGWGGVRRSDEKVWMPRLFSIDPILLLRGQVHVNLPAFPKKEPEPEKEGGVSVVDLLRNEILPKWKVEGSKIELGDFRLDTGTDKYLANFDLSTLDEGKTVRAVLRSFESSSGDLKGRGVIELTRPEDWLKNQPAPQGGKRSWKLIADASVDLPGPASVKLKADSDIYDWQSLDARIATLWKGVSTLREARLQAALRGPKADGKFSLKMGSKQSEIRALDFVNCGIDADLDKKVGGLACGPQTVRLQVREQSFLRKPEFFTFAPEFNLRVNRIAFGEEKAADFTFDFNMRHMGFAVVRAGIEGTARKSEKEGLRFNVAGNTALSVTSFKRLVEFLRDTRYAIPAPLNVMEGPVTTRLDLDLNENGGRVGYDFVPWLNSKHQAMHVRLTGNTELTRTKKGLEPVTEAAVYIDDLRISVPRLDLRAPPQMKPDSRFGPIRIKDGAFAKTEKETQPLNLRLRVQTTSPRAIQLATNLTKTAIPIGLDLLYEDIGRKPPKGGPGPSLTAPGREPASVFAGGVRVIDPEGEKKKEKEKEPGPVLTGKVSVGETPIDIFRRNAMISKLDVKLLPSGRKTVDGAISVKYLEYDIKIMISGDSQEPQIKLASDPPLEDDQILAVLLFGRPLNELDEDQKTSVNSMNSAVADAAVGLASLYLLASTPIESLGYDPEKQMVTAKVGLGGGASLELGSSGEALNTVGFRKRLSADFVLRSQVEKVASSGRQTVSGVIEWVRRF